jgi:hypothetical protein
MTLNKDPVDERSNLIDKRLDKGILSLREHHQKGSAIIKGAPSKRERHHNGSAIIKEAPS